VISLEDGLSQSTIFAIAQDQLGLMWFGTEDGLNCYDGYEFKVYKNEPFDSTSLPHNQVSALLADTKGRLWVGLSMKGLALFEPVGERFINFQSDKKNEASLSNGSINCIYEDLRGQIWVGTANGLNRIEEKGGVFSFHRCSVPGDYSNNKPLRYIKCLYEDRKGNLWVGTANGLGRYNRLTEEIEPVQFDINQTVNDRSELRLPVINSISEDRLGRLWLGTSDGLMQWNARTGERANFLTNKTSKEHLSVSKVLHNLEGDLYIGTVGGGLFVWIYDDEKGDYACHKQHFVANADKEKPLNNTLIRSLHLDHLNPEILWIGYTTGGIEKLIPDQAIFVSDDLSEPMEMGLHNPYVSGLAKDDRGGVWIATATGLVYEDPLGGYELYQHDNQNRNTPRADYITVVMQDQKDRLWLGTSKGLDRVSRQEDGEVIFEHLSPDKRRKPGEVNAFFEDDAGYVYMGVGGELNVYDPDLDEFLPYNFAPDPGRGRQRGYNIYSIHKDSKNRLWIGSTMGLSLYRDIHNPFKELPDAVPEIYYHNPRDTQSLRNDQILCIQEDRDGNIWLGTFNGLIRVKDDGKKLTFEPFTEREGLTNNVVYGILEDTDNHSLWLSTNNGLTRFFLDQKRFEKFDSRDGLQSNEFNGKAFFKASDGEMFFGGIAGYTRFYSTLIQSDTMRPRVWLTSLRYGNDEQINLLYSKDKKVKLNYSENTFSLSFIAINYIRPQDNQYAYRLEGHDPNWHAARGTRQVNFSKLPPGEYTFHVKASNSAGVWNETGDKLRIIIRPPYWQTLWFYMLLAGLLALAFGSFHQYRVQANVKRVMELERVRKNAAADFHDELGHKLTVISLFGEIVKKKLKGRSDIVPQLNKIIENSNSLYYSMKDLLWVLDPNKDSLYDLAILLKDFGDELFDKTGVAYHATGLAESMRNHNLPMDQKRHIVLIFKEVMNNALKHSNCQHAALSIDYDQDQLNIAFSDDGDGFDLSAKQSGNGLVNLRTRAEKIGGELTLNSGAEGTEVRLVVKV
jgi:ligand-binding sensor domain-containing protein/signal transduction histidine kinase